MQEGVLFVCYPQSERCRNGVQVALAVPTLTLTGYGYMYIRISPSVYTCPLIVGFPQVTYFLYCFARDFEKYTEKKLIRPARPGPTRPAPYCR